MEERTATVASEKEVSGPKDLLLLLTSDSREGVAKLQIIRFGDRVQGGIVDGSCLSLPSSCWCCSCDKRVTMNMWGQMLKSGHVGEMIYSETDMELAIRRLIEDKMFQASLNNWKVGVGGPISARVYCLITEHDPQIYCVDYDLDINLDYISSLCSIGSPLMKSIWRVVSPDHRDGSISCHHGVYLVSCRLPVEAFDAADGHVMHFASEGRPENLHCSFAEPIQSISSVVMGNLSHVSNDDSVDPSKLPKRRPWKLNRVLWELLSKHDHGSIDPARMSSYLRDRAPRNVSDREIEYFVMEIFAQFKRRRRK